ncbi:MAG: hypothetical protein WCO60_09710 [Verrucomicrobiota bacterium]
MGYTAPDFSLPLFAEAPVARTQPAPNDGVLPPHFFSTTNLPTYLKNTNGTWSLPTEPRMDGCIVQTDTGWTVREPRRVLAGDPIVVGHAEDGSEGIFVHTAGFNATSQKADNFRFMSSPVSREKPIDYRSIAKLLIEQRRHGGYVVWVCGPALVHSRARDNLVWFIRNSFVQALLAGNAVAVHDIEAAIVGTTLGMCSDGSATAGGHSAHMRAINTVRACGSIEAAVHSDVIHSGIMHACVIEQVPTVLCGSIRDDGPLPGVITDSIESQNAMRAHTVQATMVVMIASALHSIAVGNMLPAYYQDPHKGLVELPTLCVDASEFIVSKLKDRGTHQAIGIVTNAQDFMSILRASVEQLILQS